MSDKLCIELEPKIDSAGNTYYVGKLRAPILIDCSEKNGGVSFVIWTSDPGNETMQISSITNPKKNKYNER
jgi:hypothetical protein